MRTAAGRSISIGRELASGGEGRVHEITGAPGEVAKLYHSPPTPALAAKLRALVGMRSPELSGVAAWPTDLIVSPSGSVVGFLMPRVDARGVIDRLSHPCERRQHFAEADYLFIATVAANLMSAAASLHARGVVIGDVNESNVMVRPNGTVAFIDVDSFQVRAGGVTHRCLVAKDLFVPPELVGKDLSSSDRSPNNDCFGLAILVFQLLMHGRHPFHGCTADGIDRSTQELVVAGAYAYSPASRIAMRPPPGAMAVSNLGPLEALFERAFLAAVRPTALEWSEALGRFKAGMRPCRANRRHAVLPGSAACALCALPRDPLPAPLGSISGTAPDIGSIRQLLAEIAGMPSPPDLRHKVSEPPLAPSEHGCPTRPGEPSPDEVSRSADADFPWPALLGTIILACATLGFAMTRRGENGACMFGAVLCIALFVTASKISRWAGSSHLRGFARAYALRRAAIAMEQATLEAAEAAAAGFEARQASLEPRLQRLRSAAAGIAARERQSSADLPARAERQYTDRWIEDQLNSFLIGAAVIPGIGAERKRVLASHGIETAADVNSRDVGGVPGFGPKLTEALTDWRSDCARTVARRTVPPMPARFFESLKREHAAELVKSVEGLRTEFAAIQHAIREREAAASYHARTVSEARAAVRRARARAIEIGPTSS